MSDSRDVVIVSACRTAIGAFMGGLSDFSPGRLGAVVVREAAARAGLQPAEVDEVIMGCILDAGCGQGVGRQAAIWGGMPVTTPAYSVNKLCGSGMKALILAAQGIRLGDLDCALAGGVECMSQAPYVLPGARKGLRLGNATMLDTLMLDGLTDAFGGVHMGLTVEDLADRYGISREEQDRFSCWSQNKAEEAQRAGRFALEIAPVEIPQKKGDPLRMERDEHPRAGCTVESLARLKPAFKADGTVTAGNASGINDGAAALALMSRKRAGELGIRPLALLRAYGVGALEPALMGLGPVPAVRQALARAGVSLADLDLIELNEAFAAQSLAVCRELELPQDRLNVNGGAIALGHPIGASGARIVVTLLYELIRRDALLGLATLCIGGGMGSAVILERE